MPSVSQITNGMNERTFLSCELRAHTCLEGCDDVACGVLDGRQILAVGRVQLCLGILGECVECRLPLGKQLYIGRQITSQSHVDAKDDTNSLEIPRPQQRRTKRSHNNEANAVTA